MSKPSYEERKQALREGRSRTTHMPERVTAADPAAGKSLADAAVERFATMADDALANGSPDYFDADLKALGVVAVVTVVGQANVFVFEDSSLVVEEDLPGAFRSSAPQPHLAVWPGQFLANVRALKL